MGSRSSIPDRSFLVFMRVGATDLLPDWLAAEPQRNWDLFVSGYLPREPHPAAIATHTGGYNKLEHFHQCVKSGVLDLSDYRYVLLADDDLAVTGGSISDFFETTERLGLTVSHPAQDSRSKRCCAQHCPPYSPPVIA